MAARIKLGELLVRAGVLDDFKLKAALAEQQRWGGRLGKILVEMNFVPEDLLVKALSKQLGVQRARLETANVPHEVLQKIDPGFAANNAICPERYFADRKTLVVAMADPTNVGAVDELRFKTGLRIETTLAGELEISQAIDRLFYGRAPIEGVDLQPGRGTDGGLQALPPAYFDQNVTERPPTPPQQQMPPTLNQLLSQPPSFPTGPFNAQARPGPPPLPATPPPMQGPAGSPAMEMAVALDGAQKKQLKAIRVMLELLIEKGVFSRDEYLALVNKR